MMELKESAKLLRIFLGESDKAEHASLYAAIVREARQMGLAGATVWRGIMGFGATSRIRTAKILDLSSDMPIIIEIADSDENINRFIPVLHNLFDAAKSGGLVTIEDIKVIKYHAHDHDDSQSKLAANGGNLAPYSSGTAVKSGMFGRD